MANFAYKDEQRKHIISAAQASKENRDNIYFCQNPHCNAHLHLCAVDGSRRAYFRATKSDYPHIETCPYRSSKVVFNENEYDETKFDFDKAIEQLYIETEPTSNHAGTSGHGIGKSKNHPISTLGQIYSMCKTFPEKAKYAGMEIGMMLLDNRSEYRYQKGCFGNRIIEAKTQSYVYDKKTQQINLEVAVGDEKFSFALEFPNDKIYKYCQNMVYNNQHKLIVVAANWQRADRYNSFKGTIFAEKQIMVVD